MTKMETKTDNLHRGESEEKKKRKRLKKLQREICEQIEFYFGDSNLRKDRFLKQEIDKTEEGYIHISTIASFNRIRKLTTDEALIARALQKSELLEVSQDQMQIRRKTPIEELKYDIDDVTVYVENLPHNVDHDILKKAFSSCGTIAYISLPRYKTSGDPKGFAFIEFTTPEDAARACELQNNPPKSNPHPDGHFPTTRKGRLILPEQHVKAKQIPENRHSDKHAKENLGKRKRDDSENGEAASDLARDEVAKKKKPDAKTEKEGKVISKSKDETERGVEDHDNRSHLHATKKVKRKEAHHGSKTKKEGRSDVVDEGRKDGDGHSRHKDKKRSRKRKHSGDETVQEKHTHSNKNHESKSHKDEKIGIDTKGEESKKDGGSSETRKRKRDDSHHSIEDSKVKKSSEPKDKEDEVQEVKKRHRESNIEEGDKRKKRSRSRRNRKDEGPSAPIMQLTVIPKKEWLALKKEYLAIQKASRQQLKQMLRETQEKHPPTQEKNRFQQEVYPEVSEEMPRSTEPEFIPGVVLMISSDKEFTSRKELREKLEEISPVAYIDLQDGDTSGFIRLKSAEGAKAVLGLTLENRQVDLKMLSGTEEQQYWDKLRADRESKLNSKKRKPRKRGVNRVMDRSERVLGIKKTFFLDEED